MVWGKQTPGQTQPEARVRQLSERSNPKWVCRTGSDARPTYGPEAEGHASLCAIDQWDVAFGVKEHSPLNFVALVQVR